MLWKVDSKDGRLVNKANDWKPNVGFYESTGYVAKKPLENPKSLFGPMLRVRPESNNVPIHCWQQYFMDSTYYPENKPPTGGLKNLKWEKGTTDNDGYFNLQLRNKETYPDRSNFDLNI